MTTRRLDDLLTHGSDGLADLASKARKMVDLGDAVRATLPESLQAHMHAATCADGQTLVVVTDSSAIGARLRFHTDDLLSAARRHGVPAARCRIRVTPQAKAGDG